MAPVARVASSVVFVADLERSVRFYRDVFGCKVAVEELDAALLLAPAGFQIYLRARGAGAQHALGGLGVQYLTWTTDSEEGLRHFERVLRDHHSYFGTHASGGVSFVEGRDPDDVPVIIAYPSPEQLPRHMLNPRFYAW